MPRQTSYLDIIAVLLGTYLYFLDRVHVTKKVGIGVPSYKRYFDKARKS